MDSFYPTSYTESILEEFPQWMALRASNSNFSKLFDSLYGKERQQLIRRLESIKNNAQLSTASTTLPIFNYVVKNVTNSEKITSIKYFDGNVSGYVNIQKNVNDYFYNKPSRFKNVSIDITINSIIDIDNTEAILYVKDYYLPLKNRIKSFAKCPVCNNFSKDDYCEFCGNDLSLINSILLINNVSGIQNLNILDTNYNIIADSTKLNVTEINYTTQGKDEIIDIDKDYWWQSIYKQFDEDMIEHVRLTGEDWNYVIKNTKFKVNQDNTELEYTTVDIETELERTPIDYDNVSIYADLSNVSRLYYSKVGEFTTKDVPKYTINAEPYIDKVSIPNVTINPSSISLYDMVNLEGYQNAREIPSSSESWWFDHNTNKLIMNPEYIYEVNPIKIPKHTIYKQYGISNVSEIYDNVPNIASIDENYVNVSNYIKDWSSSYFVEYETIDNVNYSSLTTETMNEDNISVGPFYSIDEQNNDIKTPINFNILEGKVIE